MAKMNFGGVEENVVTRDEYPLCKAKETLKDEVIAFGVSMPSLSHAFQKAKGRLFPLGIFHIWRALKKTEFIDLYLNGVHPDWQKRGIHSLFYVEMNKAYIRNKCRIAISNPQLENNTNAVGIWDKYDGKPYIRRRCYIKSIDN